MLIVSSDFNVQFNIKCYNIQMKVYKPKQIHHHCPQTCRYHSKSKIPRNMTSNNFNKTLPKRSSDLYQSKEQQTNKQKLIDNQHIIYTFFKKNFNSTIKKEVETKDSTEHKNDKVAKVLPFYYQNQQNLLSSLQFPNNNPGLGVQVNQLKQNVNYISDVVEQMMKATERMNLLTSNGRICNFQIEKQRKSPEKQITKTFCNKSIQYEQFQQTQNTKPQIKESNRKMQLNYVMHKNSLIHHKQNKGIPNKSYSLYPC